MSEIGQRASDRIKVEASPLFQKKSSERGPYNEAVKRIEADFRAELADEYLDKPATRAADEVYRVAWEFGHAYGYSEVEHYYGEIAEVANAVLREEQK